MVGYIEEEFKGKITKMFRGCPKPSGWFGCFFHTRKFGDIQLTGITGLKIEENMNLKVTAHKEVKNGREQWVVSQLTICTDTESDIIRYLTSSAFPGIGKIMAQKLWDNFKEDTLDVISTDRNKLVAIGVPDTKIDTLQIGVNRITMENRVKKLIPSLTKNAYDKLEDLYGDDLYQKLLSNPYILYTDCEMAFYKVDDIAVRNLNIAPDSFMRVQMCIYHTIKSAMQSTGHVFFELSNQSEWNCLCGNIMDTLNNSNRIASQFVSYQRVNEVLNTSDFFVIEDYYNDGQYRLYLKEIYAAEKNCARRLFEYSISSSFCHVSNAQVYKSIHRYEKLVGRRLDDDQKQAVVNALTCRVSVITGGPGRGKSTVVDCILYCWHELGPQELPVLSAPTGSAVRRLTSIVTQNGCIYQNVRTIARRNVQFKFKPDVLKDYTNRLSVIDECSMVGLKTASEMLELFQNCQVVLVGDVDQLESIEAGTFFKDVCAMSNVPKVVLQKNYRANGGNGGIILDNADKINAGASLKDLVYDVDKFMVYSYKEDDMTYADFLVKQYMDYLAQGFDFNDIGVICPMSSLPTGVKALNGKIQNVVNRVAYNTKPVLTQSGSWEQVTRGFEIPGTYYDLGNSQHVMLRVCDRVMMTRNHYDVLGTESIQDANGNYISTAETVEGIFNGDCGEILCYRMATTGDDSNIIVFRTDDGRLYNLTEEYFYELDLAYVLTVHKVQGCEYSVVLFSAQCKLANMPEWIDFGNRNLLYTAVTRAKNAVKCIGSMDSIVKCINTLPHVRHSLLREKYEDLVLNMKSLSQVVSDHFLQ